METDKTNFAQSLMHTIKGNLGTGILAMAASFAHCGLLYSIIGLPILCLISTYCVHLLIRSSQHLENKMKWLNMDYAELAKGSFKSGPRWMKPYSGLMCSFVDFILVINQLGICCVYIVFMVDNIFSMFLSHSFLYNKNLIFVALIPFVLTLCYIRTLKRLSYISGIANASQVVGIAIILQHLVRTFPSEVNVKMTKPISEVALGFGAAMFAFEGISVVLPIYSRMKRREQMGGCCGIINVSYGILLVLYFLMGLVGYLKYGDEAKGSITINLPERELLYDCVRGIFVMALLLTYPLQFYVPFEILWTWLNSKISSMDGKQTSKQQAQGENLKLEYIFRTFLVLATFVLAMSVPRLNLMMDLVGSISGTALSIMLPALIHIAAFWEDTSGSSRIFLVVVDILLIVIGAVASASGSYFSFVAIVRSFGDPISASHIINNSTTVTTS